MYIKHNNILSITQQNEIRTVDIPFNLHKDETKPPTGMMFGNRNKNLIVVIYGEHISDKSPRTRRFMRRQHIVCAMEILFDILLFIVSKFLSIIRGKCDSFRWKFLRLNEKKPFRLHERLLMPFHKLV